MLRRAQHSSARVSDLHLGSNESLCHAHYEVGPRIPLRRYLAVRRTEERVEHGQPRLSSMASPCLWSMARSEGLAVAGGVAGVFGEYQWWIAQPLGAV